MNRWLLFGSLLLCACACVARPAVLVGAEQAAAATGPSRPVRLRIVTFNVQDLFVADRRAERMRAIGRLLGGLAPDLVGLQEAFSAGHRKQLVRELERVSGLDYHEVYFPSGMMGSGLFILSRHPVVRAVFWRYTKNGSPLAVKHGDWYAGKGVGMVQVRLENGLLDFFDTHAIANYGTHAYTDDRLQQMREFAAFITAQAQSRAPAFAVGDLNCAPGSPEFRIATATPALTDLLGADPTAYRIDHILMRPHPAYDVTLRGTQVLASGRDDEGKSLILSDHVGFVVDVTLQPGTDPGR